MTREEAIEQLRNLSQTNFYPSTIMALDMAIEALQNLSKPNNGLQGSDLISRQDAIKRFGEDGTWLERQGVTTLTMVEAKQRAVDILESLPSADRPTVDKEYLIDLIQEAVYDGEACAKLMDLVDRPTGEWINREKCQVDEDAYEVAICSECGAEMTIEYPHDSYCPNCGAKMGGDTE